MHRAKKLIVNNRTERLVDHVWRLTQLFSHTLVVHDSDTLFVIRFYSFSIHTRQTAISQQRSPSSCRCAAAAIYIHDLSAPICFVLFCFVLFGTVLVKRSVLARLIDAEASAAMVHDRDLAVDRGRLVPEAWRRSGQNRKQRGE